MMETLIKMPRKNIIKEKLVLENWEEAKKVIALEKEWEMYGKKEQKDISIKEKNREIHRRMTNIIWDAIRSFLMSKNIPAKQGCLNFPEIIKVLKPEKKHLSGFMIKHYVPARFFNLDLDLDRERFYDPRNLKFLAIKHKKGESNNYKIFIND